MCGIAGIFHFAAEPGQRVDSGLLVRIRDQMVHRGPDGAGVWVAPDGEVGLAFRRLAILDLSDAALQPMANEDGSVMITFNGEIYNHAPLRQQLLAAGHTFRTDHSDTEVIVHGYEEWGIAGLVQRLRGMFAIAIWDGNLKTLHLVRDRVGIKPLYFALRNGKLVWGSEIKAILAHPEVPWEVEEIAMFHYLSFMTTPSPLTMFRGVYKLAPAHRLELRMGGAVALERYWDVLARDLEPFRETDERFYLDELRRLLEGSVASHMMSDVPYGAFLSGGVDSSLNVALMKKFSDRPVSTFTVGYSDHTHLNELDHARRVSALFGTRHHEVLIKEADMAGYLDQLVHTQDEPLADWVCIPLYFVSKLVRDSGTTVVQVGEGADEQFAGYEGYAQYLNLHYRCFNPYAKLPGPLRSTGAALARLAANVRPSLEPYAELVERAARGREAFWSGALVFNDRFKRWLIPCPERVTSGVPAADVAAGLVPPEVLSRDTFDIVRAQRRRAEALRDAPDYLTRMIYAEFQTRLPELLLMRVDKVTMSTSIEARVPYLDHKLVEFSMRVPSAFKVRDGVGKYLLKRLAEEYLPKDLVYRKKMGFGAPMAQWLRQDFGRRVAAELLQSPLLARPLFNRERIEQMVQRHRAEVQDNSTQIWTLYNLVCWYRHWVEGRG